MLKEVLKALLPRQCLDVLQRSRRNSAIKREFRIDRRRYSAHALSCEGEAIRGLEGKRLEAQLIKDYHRIEKGLALRNPRRPFGASLSNRIDALLRQAGESVVPANVAADATSALEGLVLWNDGGEVADAISPVAAPRTKRALDPNSLFGTRHSVRDFSPHPVAMESLEEAITLALHTPSVCNRQTWLVRTYFGPVDTARLLRFQNGNAGFGEVPCVALVSVDTRMFAGPGERNQPWIEGGLFAMTLVWAMHTLGLDTCMLNLSLKNDDLNPLRTAYDLPEYEVPIVMIAIGYGRPGHRITRSPHRGLHEVWVRTSE